MATPEKKKNLCFLALNAAVWEPKWHTPKEKNSTI
jgi:hypothetical protein